MNKLKLDSARLQPYLGGSPWVHDGELGFASIILDLLEVGRGRRNLLSWDVGLLLVFFCLVVSVCAGVDDSETLKVHRSGGADPDGNQPGDLYVTIKVPYISF